MEELIKRMKKGDETALQELIEKTKSKAFYTAMGILKNEQDAEEVVNSAYFQVYKKISTLKDVRKFNSWFSKIIINLSLTKIKNKSNKELIFSQLENAELNIDYLETISEEDHNNDPEETAISNETYQTIQEIMNNLKQDQKLCLEYYYFNELSINEISKLFHIPKNTVKTRLRLGREKIKTEYEKKQGKVFSISIIPSFFNDQIKECPFKISVSEIIQHASSSAIVSTGATVANTVIVKKVIAVTVAATVAAGGTGAAVKLVSEKRNSASEQGISELSPQQQTNITNAMKYSEDDYANNIAGAIAVQIGDDIFYSDIEKNCIFKMTDHNKETVFIDDITCYQMFAYNDYLYYLDEEQQMIYKVNVNTKDEPTVINKGKILLSDGDGTSVINCINLYVKGNDLIYISSESGKVSYYSNESQEVYAYDLDRGESKLIKRYPSQESCFIKREGIYSVYDPATYKTYNYDINGSVIGETSINTDTDQTTNVFENMDYIVLETYYETNDASMVKYEATDKLTGDVYHVLTAQLFAKEILYISVIDDVLYAFLHTADLSSDSMNTDYSTIKIDLKS